MAKAARTRTFSVHGSSGVIEEEAQLAAPRARPTVQLLKFTKGDAAGSYALRFCQYDGKGRLRRAPLVIDASDVRNLKKALAPAPKLRKLLAQLA